jgi:hypothetical protein
LGGVRVNTIKRAIILGGYVSGLFGIAAIFKDYFSIPQTGPQYVAAIAIVVLMAFLIIGWGYREYEFGRKARYAAGLRSAHAIMHSIRNSCTFQFAVYERLGSIGVGELRLLQEKCRNEIIHILDNIKNVFELATSVQCRATIKVFNEGDDGTIYVNTLVRDKNSQIEWEKLDRKRANENNDPILDNPYFYKIAFDEEFPHPYIMVNDIGAEPEYLTTSARAYDRAFDMDMGRVSLRRRLLGKKPTWPLPYKSTLTYAIQQSDDPNLGIGETEVVAFLAVDSPSRNVFDRRWDIDLMAALADSLFHTIYTYADIQEHLDRLENGNGQILESGNGESAHAG